MNAFTYLYIHLYYVFTDLLIYFIFLITYNSMKLKYDYIQIQMNNLFEAYTNNSLNGFEYLKKKKILKKISEK